MVPQGLQALVALLVLLPGFVSTRIVRLLSAKAQQSELERIIEALIFSFFTYVVYILCFGAILPLEWEAAVSGGLQHYALVVHRWHLLSIPVIAILLGFVWGYVRGNDLHLKRLRLWNVTPRSSRESLWAEVFMNFGGTVQVELGDGRSVVGWLRQYAESGEERTLFLEKARWITDSLEAVEVPGDGLVLLTEKSEIKYVMFLDEGRR